MSPITPCGSIQTSQRTELMQSSSSSSPLPPSVSPPPLLIFFSSSSFSSPPLPAPTSPPPHLFLLIFFSTTSSSSFSHHPLIFSTSDPSPALQCPQRLPCSSSSTPSPPPPPYLLLFSTSSSFSLPPLLPPLHLLVFSTSHCSPAVSSSGGTRPAFLPVLKASPAPPSPHHLVLLLYLLFLIFSFFSTSSSPLFILSSSHWSPAVPSTGGTHPALLPVLKGSLAPLPAPRPAPRPAPLPPLCLRCAALTFKGLAWPRAAPCHALGPEMPSPTSTALSSGAGWVSTISSAELRHATRKMDRV